MYQAAGPVMAGGGAVVGGGGAVVAGGGGGGGAIVAGRGAAGGVVIPGGGGGGGAAGGACCAVPGGGDCSVFSNENCGAACGVKSACCDGGGAQFGWVGPYGGSYTTETQYRYVGPGFGEFDYIKPTPNFCVCIVSSSVILLLLILLGWFLFKDATSTTTQGGCMGCLATCPFVRQSCRQYFVANTIRLRPVTLPAPPAVGMCSMANVARNCPMCSRYGPPCVPAGPIKICLVWGDPHVTTFDGAKASYYTPGEFWIVKSTTVKIQGRYRPTHATSGLSVMKEIAIGGSFIQGKVIIVTATSATFAGQPILTGFPSSFDGASMGLAGFSAQLNSQGETLQSGRNVAKLRIVHLSLPNNVNIQINRWTEPAEGTYINAKISMPAQPGMDGHCGNFNGNQADDARIQVRGRIGVTGVAQGEMLFVGAKLPVGQSSRYDINNCPKPTLENAKAKCKAKEHKFIPSMGCLIDVCVGGAGFAAEGN